MRDLKPADGSPAVRQTASHRVSRAGRDDHPRTRGFDNDVDVISQAIGLMTGRGRQHWVLPVEDLDY